MRPVHHPRGVRLIVLLGLLGSLLLVPAAAAAGECGVDVCPVDTIVTDLGTASVSVDVDDVVTVDFVFSPGDPIRPFVIGLPRFYPPDPIVPPNPILWRHYSGGIASGGIVAIDTRPLGFPPDPIIPPDPVIPRRFTDLVIISIIPSGPMYRARTIRTPSHAIVVFTPIH